MIKTPAQDRWSGSKSIPGRQLRNFFSLHIKLPLKLRQKCVSFEQSSNSSIHSLMSSLKKKNGLKYVRKHIKSQQLINICLICKYLHTVPSYN